VKFSLNPLQWLATDDGWLDFTAQLPPDKLQSEVSRLGFDSLQADVPAGADPAAYLTQMESHGLVPAPGYMSATLEKPEAREEIVARYGALAATHQALGLTEVFVACSMNPAAVRVANPAIGAEADEARLEEIALTLELVGAETSRYGVTACLHQHVGTWIESEDEVEWLLERLDPELVALGPDTGHLAWAGVDPIALVKRHGTRVRGAHVKDLKQSVAESTRGGGDNYKQVVAQGLWAEPGLGDLDFDAFFAALPQDFSGWLVIEVDKPSLPTPEESIAECARWAAENGG
jgi:inosose dehydratase